MVTQESACRIGFNDELGDRQPLSTNHSDLVKFANHTDDIYARVQNTLRRLVDSAPGTIQGRFSSITKLTDDEKRHWDDLNVPDYRAFKKDKKVATPAKGTLQWLVSDRPSEITPDADSLCKENFDEWRDSTKPASLLVTGPPGKGKSVLSNFVVDHLVESIGDRKLRLIYYFCNIRNDENFRNSRAVLRALIVQLCEDRKLFQNLPNRFRTDRLSFYSASFDELLGTFDDLVRKSSYDWIYCVIDGLDVYADSEMDDFLARLQDSMRHEEYRLKLFCTSRPDGPVETFLPDTKRILQSRSADIELFVDERLQQLPKKYTVLKGDIRESVLRSSGGTFLWINIVLRRVSKIRYPTAQTVKETIEATPQELDELYKKLVQNAQKDKLDVAILAWITYAKQPLFLKQIETATAVMVAGGSTWAECCDKKTSLDSDTIRENLGTLVDIIGGRLYLIHQSLRDFLRGDFGIQQQLPHPDVELGKACMAFLSFDDLDTQDMDIHGMYPENSYFQYASNFWYKHIDNPEDIKGDEGKLRRILQEPRVRLWLKHAKRSEFLWGRWRRRESRQTKQSIFKIAIRFDIAWLAKLLLDQTSPDLSETCQDSWLIEAARLAPGVFNELINHPTSNRIKMTDQLIRDVARSADNSNMVIELLLKRGDEIKITPIVLEVAAAINKELMELLLKKGGNEAKITPMVVEAAAEDKESMELLLAKRGDEVQITPRIVEMAARDKDMMELLLEKRGDEVQITPEVVEMAARDKDMMELLLEKRGDEIKITPEVVVVAAEDKDMMELLLEKRGDEIKITPEVVVVAAEDKEVMELLLEKRGDEVRITAEVVLAAVNNGYIGKEVIELLLEKRGGEVQITAEVVLAAVNNMYYGEEVMELLLEKRGGEVQITAEVVLAAAENSWGFNNMLEVLLEKRGDEVQITAEVVLAAVRDQDGKEVMELLLEKRGDEVRITAEVVLAAVNNGYIGKEVIELLLEERPEEVAAAMSGQVVLTAAANGHYGILEIFHQSLRHLYPQKDWDEWDAIAAFRDAAEEGDAETIRKLLLNGVTPDTKDSQSQTPLWAAAAQGNTEVVELLVARKDVNKNSLDEDGQGPIFWPCLSGYEDIVGLLIANGADPTVKNRNGDTPVSRAKEAGHEGVLQILEQRGYTI
ncbi:hypothetical protein ACO1O0_000954 [Amphichorda felina]